MGFVVLMRNPANRKLLAILDEEDRLVEYETYDAAVEAAEKLPLCEAWGFEPVKTRI